jgi:hypothetical protein
MPFNNSLAAPFLERNLVHGKHHKSFLPHTTARKPATLGRLTRKPISSRTR